MSHPMETRGKNKSDSDSAISDTEMRILEQKLREKEALLRTQDQQLRDQRAELDAARKRLEIEREELSLRELEIAERQREITKKWPDNSDAAHPMQHTFPIDHVSGGQYAYLTCPPVPRANSGEPIEANVQMPKITFREATESVPIFDGYNISLQQFTRACRRARELVPSSAERNLTKFLIAKLRNRAYYAVEDEPCDTVTQLIDLLTGAFGSPKTIDQYRGELSTIYLKPHEHVIDYISRVKDLRTSILDTERRDKGSLDPHFISEVDGLTARSFCEGLPLEYRLQMRAEARQSYTEAFATAKMIAKRQELDRQRYEPRYRENRDRDNRRVNPIGNPLAHSTPRRSEQSNYRRENQESRTDPSNRYSPARPNSYYRGNQPKSNEASEKQGSRLDSGSSPNNYSRSAGREANSNNSNKFCRYCKNAGHEIEECRKRQYVNSQRRESGNSNGPPGPSGTARADETRKARPVNPINVEETSEDESQS